MSTSTVPSAVHARIVAAAEAARHPDPGFSDPYHSLALQVLHNLRFQHDWSELTVHTNAPPPPLPNGLRRLPRPLVSGLPPRRIYVHPDEQIDIIKAGVKDDDLPPEREWVLPSSLREKWSLKHFADVFDAIPSLPPAPNQDDSPPASKWRRTKRLVLATLDSDSTVTYYVVHDGIVKPRQN